MGEPRIGRGRRRSPEGGPVTWPAARAGVAAADIDGDGRLPSGRLGPRSPRCAARRSSRRWARWSPGHQRGPRRLAAHSIALSTLGGGLPLAGARAAGLIRAVCGMRERGWGRIVNVGSSPRANPRPGCRLHLGHRRPFKTLSREVAAEDHGQPVATGQIQRSADQAPRLGGAGRRAARSEVPAGRLGTPEEYGDLVAFLCSERAGYLTGAVIPLDGGLLRSV
jgi:hypothetical protein